MAAEQPILAVRDIHRDFGGLRAVDGASFDARRGRITGLIGPNGAELGRMYWGRNEDALVEEARGVLDRFGMAAKENELGGNLSGGQKRLLEIMRGLMAKPKLLLLDEPFAGVNPTLAEEIETYLIGLRDDGLSMVMVEHELSIVERLCDPVVVMAHGKVISEGSMSDVTSQKEVLDAYLIG